MLQYSSSVGWWHVMLDFFNSHELEEGSRQLMDLGV